MAGEACVKFDCEGAHPPERDQPCPEGTGGWMYVLVLRLFRFCLLFPFSCASFFFSSFSFCFHRDFSVMMGKVFCVDVVGGFSVLFMLKFLLPDRVFFLLCRRETGNACADRSAVHRQQVLHPRYELTLFRRPGRLVCSCSLLLLRLSYSFARLLYHLTSGLVFCCCCCGVGNDADLQSVC